MNYHLVRMGTAAGCWCSWSHRSHLGVRRPPRPPPTKLRPSNQPCSPMFGYCRLTAVRQRRFQPKPRKNESTPQRSSGSPPLPHPCMCRDAPTQARDTTRGLLLAAGGFERCLGASHGISFMMLQSKVLKPCGLGLEVRKRCVAVPRPAASVLGQDNGVAILLSKEGPQRH